MRKESAYGRGKEHTVPDYSVYMSNSLLIALVRIRQKWKKQGENDNYYNQC